MGRTHCFLNGVDPALSSESDRRHHCHPEQPFLQSGEVQDGLSSRQTQSFHPGSQNIEAFTLQQKGTQLDSSCQWEHRSSSEEVERQAWGHG